MRILVAGATGELGYPPAALRPAARHAAGAVSRRTAATELGWTLDALPVACDACDLRTLGEPHAEHRPRLAVLRGQVGNAVNHDVHRWASANPAPRLPDPNQPACRVAHRGQRSLREDLPGAGAEAPEPALHGAEPMLLADSAHSRVPTDGDPGAPRNAFRAATGLIHARMAPQPSGPG